MGFVFLFKLQYAVFIINLSWNAKLDQVLLNVKTENVSLTLIDRRFGSFYVYVLNLYGDAPNLMWYLSIPNIH